MVVRRLFDGIDRSARRHSDVNERFDETNVSDLHRVRMKLSRKINMWQKSLEGEYEHLSLAIRLHRMNSRKPNRVDNCTYRAPSSLRESLEHCFTSFHLGNIGRQRNGIPIKRFPQPISDWSPNRKSKSNASLFFSPFDSHSSFRRLIPISIPLTNDDDDDEQTSSTDQNKTESSQTSDCTALAQLLPPLPPPLSAPTVSFFHYKTTPISYFNSNIESAMIRRLEEDDEPIPFIDDNLSIANSRKSSACWSDRTSLSSRLGFSRKFNFRRSRSQLRTDTIQEQDGRKRKRRHRHQQHRTNHLSILPQEQLRINEFV